MKRAVAAWLFLFAVSATVGFAGPLEFKIRGFGLGATKESVAEILSKATLAKELSSTAIGIEVVPMLNRFRNGTTPGTSHPSRTPRSMAPKIHPVR